MKSVRYPHFLLLLLALGLALGARVRADEKAAEPTPAAAQSAPAVTEPAPEAKAEAAQVEAAAEKADEATVVPEAPKNPEPPKSGHGKRHRSGRGEVVNVGSDSNLAAGEEAEVVVSVLGSATSAGDVRDAIVSVIGGTHVNGGTVGDAAVSVLGDNYINGHVKGQVVAVLGDLEFGPNAVVDGEVISIGGELKKDPAAALHGSVQNIGLKGLTAWFKECVLKARPLAFDARVLWAWGIALAFFFFYFLIALLVPAGVNKCAETLEQRPGSSVLTAVLTLILTPITYLLLVFTVALGIGVALIQLFSAGLFLASLFGKAVMLVWIGRRLLGLIAPDSARHPALAILLGGTVVLLLYTVPVIGFVTYKLLGILGLGVVIYTLILQFKANRAARPAPVPAAPAYAAGVPVTPTGEAGAAIPVAPVGLPPVISAATLPRVGFWLRLTASFLDFILVAIVMGMLSKVFHGWFSPGGSVPFWFAVYCVVMWATKGTTIGGIICGLKLVRLDDRPLDWSVAIVRALGGFLSFAVVGLGFIWVSFDDERQSWHDKIAGTTIVKVPKGTTLL